LRFFVFVFGTPPAHCAAASLPPFLFCRHARASALCFTGGSATGRAVAAAAAAAAAASPFGVPPRLQLELGGKGAVYVRADVADIQKTARKARSAQRAKMHTNLHTIPAIS
jgi:acyl-CoA reductase-like NAD-dependent aldehyde dehydrogenase